MKILITRHDKIGDFITALPLVYVLKTQTNYHISVLVSRVNAPLAKALDFIDEVFIYDKEDDNLVHTLKAQNFDVSISAFIDMDLGKLLYKTGIPLRIAPATKLAQIFFSKRVKQRRSQVLKTEFAYNLDLAKALDADIALDFPKPLYDFETEKEDFVIFHLGSGGSAEGNLKPDDYLLLAKKASKQCKVVFSFGKDDEEAKAYVQENIDFEARLRDDFETILAFARYISKAKLFVSTSTGPMHLAGLSNTATLSFFGTSLFASSARWASISDKSKQHNFELPLDYDEELYVKIEDTLMEIL